MQKCLYGIRLQGLKRRKFKACKIGLACDLCVGLTGCEEDQDHLAKHPVQRDPCKNRTAGESIAVTGGKYRTILPLSTQFPWKYCLSF